MTETSELEQTEEVAEFTSALEGKQIWAIGGGKGGVGKTFLTANLAVALAQIGREVIVVDTDLGGANMHTCLGIPYPKRTLSEFIGGKVSSLSEIVVPTIQPRLQLICGASDILWLANPRYAQKQKLIRHLQRLKADYILLDLGGGTGYNVLDFFNQAHVRLAVVTGEPTSIQSGYGFIKSALYRHLLTQLNGYTLVADLLKHQPLPGIPEAPATIDEVRAILSSRLPSVAERFGVLLDSYRCRLVLNMVQESQEKRVAGVFQSVARDFLGIGIETLGGIMRDDAVPRSVDRMTPVLLSSPESGAANRLKVILRSLLMSIHREEAARP